MQIKFIIAGFWATSLLIFQPKVLHAKDARPEISMIYSSNTYKSTSDDPTVILIRKTLNRLLQSNISSLTQEDRKFAFSKIDLNDDGKDEILIGLFGGYFCGSGGCTAYLLSAQGLLISRFTVSDYPFLVSPVKTLGWKNLITRSAGSYRTMKWNGKKYPANPSLQRKSDDSEVNGKLTKKLFSYQSFKNGYLF